MREITVAKLIFFPLLVRQQPEGSLRQRISQKEAKMVLVERGKEEQWNFNVAVLSFHCPPKESNYYHSHSACAVFAYL